MQSIRGYFASKKIKRKVSADTLHANEHVWESGPNDMQSIRGYFAFEKIKRKVSADTLHVTRNVLCTSQSDIQSIRGYFASYFFRCKVSADTLHVIRNGLKSLLVKRIHTAYKENTKTNCLWGDMKIMSSVTIQ